MSAFVSSEITFVIFFSIKYLQTIIFLSRLNTRKTKEVSCCLKFRCYIWPRWWANNKHKTMKLFSKIEFLEPHMLFNRWFILFCVNCFLLYVFWGHHLYALHSILSIAWRHDAQGRQKVKSKTFGIHFSVVSGLLLTKPPTFCQRLNITWATCSIMKQHCVGLAKGWGPIATSVCCQQMLIFSFPKYSLKCITGPRKNWIYSSFASFITMQICRAFLQSLSEIFHTTSKITA